MNLDSGGHRAFDPASAGRYPRGQDRSLQHPIPEQKPR